MAESRVIQNGPYVCDEDDFSNASSTRTKMMDAQRRYALHYTDLLEILTEFTGVCFDRANGTLVITCKRTTESIQARKEMEEAMEAKMENDQRKRRGDGVWLQIVHAPDEVDIVVE